VLFVAVGVVPPAKSNLTALEAKQTMVGDGHAMGVTGHQVVEDILGTAKRWLSVDDPVLPEQGTDQRAETAWGFLSAFWSP